MNALEEAQDILSRPDELVDGATFRRVLAGLVAAYQSLDEDFAEFIDDYGE
jgi:hypothetical protein